MTLLIAVASILTTFLEVIENRNGVHFNDPLLKIIKPLDLTWLTFAFIYTGLIVCLYFLIKYPGLLKIAFLSYALLLIFRMASMYLLPLNPPATMIPLNDPFVQFFGNGEILTKDLFFSGHTSTSFLCFLLLIKSRIRFVFLALTIIIGLFVIIQHVHYSIDVLAAPFFSFGSYRLAIYFINKIS
ncbi:MAG: phosphatase PAP2-related protein [Ignavibacteria bacterium]